MKKTFTLMAVMALCASAGAQTLRMIELPGKIGVDAPGLMVANISPDGKYVCGTLQYGFGYFIGDVEADPMDIVWAPTDDDFGAELRHVSNTGVAIGYDGPGITVNMEGVKTELEVPSQSYEYVLGEAITSDGTLLVGSLVDGFKTFPAISKEYGTWTMLPYPSDEERGMWAAQGVTAKFVSGDGKVILGGLGPLGPAILWVMDENGEYQIDPLYSKYAVMNHDDYGKEFGFFRPSGVSPNGRYVLITATLPESQGGFLPVVYDLETKEVTQYDNIHTVQGYEIGLTPTAIADDGTFVGVVGDVTLNLGGFIMRAGEYDYELLADIYPQFEEFWIMDQCNMHEPTGISADGRYIVGCAWYSEEFKDPDVDWKKVDPYFTSYILDRGEQPEVNGVEGVASATTSDAVYYTLDGVKVTDPRGGVFIRVQDGKASKVAIR